MYLLALVSILPHSAPVHKVGRTSEIGELTAVALDLVRKVAFQGVGTEERARCAGLDESSTVVAGHVELAIRRIDELAGRVRRRALHAEIRVVLGYVV